MYTLKQIRDTVENYLGVRDMTKSLTDISDSDPIAFLNDEINNTYRYEISQEYGSFPEINYKVIVLVNKGTYYLNLDNFLKIESIYSNGYRLQFYSDRNTDIFCSADTQELNITIGQNFYSQNIIATHTLFIIQNGITVAQGTIEGNIIDMSTQTVIGQISRASDDITYEITSNILTGTAQIKYKTIRQATPYVFCNYKNSFYMFDAACLKDSIFTVKGIVKPKILSSDDDATVFKINEIDNLIALDVAYKIALRLHNTGMVARISSIRFEVVDRIARKISI